MSGANLAGRRVLVTRAAHQAAKLSDGLRALGAEPVEVPLLELQPPESFETLDRALFGLNDFDWLILTSANTIHAMKRRADQLGIVFPPAAGMKVAAVGKATAESARNHGLQITLIPESYLAESLADALAGLVSGTRILLARAAKARDVLPDALRAAGAAVRVVDTYRNVMPAGAPELLRRALADGIDAATFTSSSSVTRLAEAVRVVGLPWPLTRIPAISIGPITSETLRSEGWEPAVEADPSGIPGLIAAFGRFFSENKC